MRLISAGRNPTYADFEEEGISRSALSVGIRALQALGLLGVKRSPREKGCQRYGQNDYWVIENWRRFETSGDTKASKAGALEYARTVVRAARKGGEDVTPPVQKGSSRQELATEMASPDLLVPEVRVRGSDSGTDSYERVRLASKTQDSSRPTTFDEVHREVSGERKGQPPQPPDRYAGDPGPMSMDDYGYDLAHEPYASQHDLEPPAPPPPPVLPSPPPPPAPSYAGWRPPCGEYGCKDGCRRPASAPG